MNWSWKDGMTDRKSYGTERNSFLQSMDSTTRSNSSAWHIFWSVSGMTILGLKLQFVDLKRGIQFVMGREREAQLSAGVVQAAQLIQKSGRAVTDSAITAWCKLQSCWPWATCAKLNIPLLMEVLVTMLISTLKQYLVLDTHNVHK